jgi:hypothetical protein
MRMRSRLPKGVHGEQSDDDTCGRTGGEREQGHNEDDADLAVAHPLALSTSRTVNCRLPGGVISNDSPQCPTMTSAGAERT